MALRSKTCCAAAVLVFTMPAAAQAATKSVDLGTPPSAAKKLQKSFADVNAFFPSAISIHVGDAVRFVPTGFHSVHFHGKTGKAGVPIVLTGKKIAGINDAAGAPFAFNGLPELGLNPVLFNPKGLFGKTIVTNGTKDIQSALPLADHAKAMTVRFTKAGSFTYYCELHPGMKGKVNVLPKSRRVPSAAADAARVRLQVSKAVTVAKALLKKTTPPNTIDLGRYGGGGVTLFAFLPSKLTVPVGTTVSFRMAPGDLEVHTATTGPGDGEQPNTFLGKLAGSLESPTPDQSALYPSDLGSTAALTPTLHGNGFWNGGAMDSHPQTPLPMSTQVTLAAPGTYMFQCMIHPFMKGEVTAQ